MYFYCGFHSGQNLYFVKTVLKVSRW